jgi:hypothetical protein
MFLVAIPVSVLSVIAALFIKQVRLRTSNTAPEVDGGPAGNGVPVGVGAPADAGGAVTAGGASDMGGLADGGSDGATAVRAPNGAGPDAAAGLDGAGTGTDAARVVTPEGTD